LVRRSLDRGQGVERLGFDSAIPGVTGQGRGRSGQFQGVASVADLAVQAQGLAEVVKGLLNPSELVLVLAEVAEVAGFAPTDPELLVQGQCLGLVVGRFRQPS
jgi:hypothetical protein